MVTNAAQPLPQALPPPPPLPADAALFLDFDGTLVPIAPRPDAVQVPPGLPALLEQLQRRLGGALAILTGRPLQEVDRRLAPFASGAAGLHGVELRLTAGAPAFAPPTPETRALLAALRQRFGGDPRILVEDKRACVALHFRQAPERADECQAALRALAPADRFEIITGHMVVEARPHGAGKGHALRALLGQAPFAGRRPVFAGDDVTDEDGFDAAALLGGYGIKIGPGATRARYRCADTAALARWLREGLDGAA